MADVQQVLGNAIAGEIRIDSKFSANNSENDAKTFSPHYEEVRRVMLGNSRGEESIDRSNEEKQHDNIALPGSTDAEVKPSKTRKDASESELLLESQKKSSNREPVSQLNLVASRDGQSTSNKKPVSGDNRNESLKLDASREREVTKKRSTNAQAFSEVGRSNIIFRSNSSEMKFSSMILSEKFKLHTLYQNSAVVSENEGVAAGLISELERSSVDNSINKSVGSTTKITITPNTEQSILARVTNALVRRDHNGRLEIALDPPELGKLIINFDFHPSGKIKAAVNVENSMTYDIVRRNIEILKSNIENLGAGEIDLTMNYSENDGLFDQHRARARGGELFEAYISNSSAQPPVAMPFANFSADGRIDYKV